MTIAIQGGTFQDEPVHEYRDEMGQWVPSITQVLRLQGLSDYSGIDKETLDNASRRGTAVHELAAVHNRLGEVSPDCISEELAGYFTAYLQFLYDSGFKVDAEWVERPIVATIYGMKIGVTPDCHGYFGKTPAIIELKATAVEMPSWALQTAAQEAAIYKSNRCGRVLRHALMLRNDGTYRLLEAYKDHEGDMANMIAALRNVWWRIGAGQDVRSKLAE